MRCLVSYSALALALVTGASTAHTQTFVGGQYVEPIGPGVAAPAAPVAAGKRGKVKNTVRPLRSKAKRRLLLFNGCTQISWPECQQLGSYANRIVAVVDPRRNPLRRIRGKSVKNSPSGGYLTEPTALIQSS